MQLKGEAKGPKRTKGSRKNNLTFWHLSFRPPLADTHSQNPQNSLLLLWFCSIGSTKSNPNLSAKSAKLFLREPQGHGCGSSMGDTTPYGNLFRQAKSKIELIKGETELGSGRRDTEFIWTGGDHIEK